MGPAAVREGRSVFSASRQEDVVPNASPPVPGADSRTTGRTVASAARRLGGWKAQARTQAAPQRAVSRPGKPGVGFATPSVGGRATSASPKRLPESLPCRAYSIPRVSGGIRSRQDAGRKTRQVPSPSRGKGQGEGECECPALRPLPRRERVNQAQKRLEPAGAPTERSPTETTRT